MFTSAAWQERGIEIDWTRDDSSVIRETPGEHLCEGIVLPHYSELIALSSLTLIVVFSYELNDEGLSETAEEKERSPYIPGCLNDKQIKEEQWTEFRLCTFFRNWQLSITDS